MDRLTARTKNGFAYLVNVKPNEQVVECEHENTLNCIRDCFERLAQYEDTGLTPGDVKDLQALCKENGHHYLALIEHYLKGDFKRSDIYFVADMYIDYLFSRDRILSGQSYVGGDENVIEN